LFRSRAGLGLLPVRSVGATIHWLQAIRPASVAPPPAPPKPMHATQRALGATPTWLLPPSSPTMVPMVWVPWLPVLRGAVLKLYGSNQLELWSNPLPVLPRYWLTRGWWLWRTPGSTLRPVWTLASKPRSQTSGALILAMLASAALSENGGTASGPISGCGGMTCWTTILATPGVRDSSSISASVACGTAIEFVSHSTM